MGNWVSTIKGGATLPARCSGCFALISFLRPIHLKLPVFAHLCSSSSHSWHWQHWVSSTRVTSGTSICTTGTGWSSWGCGFCSLRCRFFSIMASFRCTVCSDTSCPSLHSHALCLLQRALLTSLDLRMLRRSWIYLRCANCGRCAVVGYLARFGSGIFLIVQMVILLDFAQTWNDAW